ncbi:hypothetical protein DBR11_02550, partial [Pedobacter sp. HMWF019]
MEKRVECGGKSYEKRSCTFGGWTPCLAALLWQGALRPPKVQDLFFWALSWEESPGMAQTC